MVATNQFRRTEVMRVADLIRMQAVVDVNENDVVNVKVGDKARVKSTPTPTGALMASFNKSQTPGKTTGTGTQEEVTNFDGENSDCRSGGSVAARG